MSLLRRRLFAERLTRAASCGEAVRLVCYPAQPRIIWRFSDGKPGHDNQSLGLVEALGRRLAIDVYDVPVLDDAGTWLDLVRSRFSAGSLLPDPWLMLGAGHATHIPLLTARRARKGRAVVIMKPDLPNTLFDLCIIPNHDRPRPGSNILVTRGSLNQMQRVTAQPQRHGMIMIGGQSKHYLWDHQTVAHQILHIIRFSGIRHWVLTTSRRTPAGFARQVRKQIYNRNRQITIASWLDTSREWFGDHLGRASCAWVTEDSVSMVYEALTAGVAVGLLAIPPRKHSRVVRGVRQLEAAQQVTTFRDWCGGRPLKRPQQTFDEASRAARWICDRWGEN